MSEANTDEYTRRLEDALLKHHAFITPDGEQLCCHCEWPIPCHSDTCIIRTIEDARAHATREDEEVQGEAIRDVIAERRRQIEVEGYTPEHDDGHKEYDLSLAAMSYAMPDTDRGFVPEPWPWNDAAWKPSDRRRNLVKSAALIIAEIERIDRTTKQKEN